MLIVFDFLQHNPEPSGTYGINGSYGEQKQFFKNLRVWDNDQRTIDDYCKDVAMDCMTRMIPCVSPDADVPGLQRYHGNPDNFRFAYDTSPVFGPGNRGTPVADFVNFYLAEYPAAEEVRITVHVYRYWCPDACKKK